MNFKVLVICLKRTVTRHGDFETQAPTNIKYKDWVTWHCSQLEFRYNWITESYIWNVVSFISCTVCRIFYILLRYCYTTMKRRKMRKNINVGRTREKRNEYRSLMEKPIGDREKGGWIMPRAHLRWNVCKIWRGIKPAHIRAKITAVTSITVSLYVRQSACLPIYLNQ